MKKKTLRGFAGVAGVVSVLLAVMIFSGGCEWENAGDEGSWNNSMGWVNFGGTYRPPRGRRALVMQFREDAMPAPPQNGNGSVFYSVINEDSGLVLAAFTEIHQGSIDYMAHYNDALAANNLTPAMVASVRLAPGTVEWSFLNTQNNQFLTQGGAADNGNGGIAGVWKNQPADPDFTASGTINYQSGNWLLRLDDFLNNTGFFFPCNLRYSYQLEITLIQDDDEGEDGAFVSSRIYENEAPTRGGWIMTLQVEQTGNKLRFTDNHGYTWEGQFSTIVTPGGDRHGNTSGEVVANFEAHGTASKKGYKLVGVFRGLYKRSDDSDGAGAIANRRIEGTWIEPRGVGDLLGVAGDIAVVAENISVAH